MVKSSGGGDNDEKQLVRDYNPVRIPMETNVRPLRTHLWYTLLSPVERV